MRILHIASLNFEVANGLTTAVMGHFYSQRLVKRQDEQVTLLNISNKEVDIEGVINWYDGYRDIDTIVKESDIIIFHGLYYKKFIEIYHIINKYRKKHVVVPHSGLTFQARKQSKLKKFLFHKLFLNKLLYNAEKIHFLSEQERKDSKPYSNLNSFIVPNGIENKNININDTCSFNQIVIGYLGRLDVYQKGLDLLCNQIKSLTKIYPTCEFRFEFYGPDFDGGKSYLNNFINKNNLNDIMKVSAPVYGSERFYLYRNFDIFIHSSRFEGLPMSILEALSMGIPCIVTKGTNFLEDVKKYDAGWDLSSMDLIEIYENIISNPGTILKKAKNSLELSSMYHWDTISKDLLNKYRSILKK